MVELIELLAYSAPPSRFRNPDPIGGFVVILIIMASIGAIGWAIAQSKKGRK